MTALKRRDGFLVVTVASHALSRALILFMVAASVNVLHELFALLIQVALHSDNSLREREAFPDRCGELRCCRWPAFDNVDIHPGEMSSEIRAKEVLGKCIARVFNPGDFLHEYVTTSDVFLNP